jgi:hypothetical protein
MDTTMRVALDNFARTGIEAQMGSDVPKAVRTAIFHYAYKLKAGRRPIEIPRFLRTRASADSKPAIDVALDGEAASLLELEAARQGATLGELVNHSVLVYLAELDFLSAAAARGSGFPGSYV